MTRSLATLVACLCSLLLASAPAHARAAPVRVTITETADGVRIVYDLPAPVTELALGGEEGSWPSEQHRLAESGLRLENRFVRADAPFRKATLLIQPDTKDVDALYPLLTRVEGKGALLFAPYILPSSAPYRLRVATGAGGLRTMAEDEAEGGFLMVGARAERSGDFDAISGTDFDGAARTFVHDRIARLIGFYRARLGRPPARRPTFILARSHATRGLSGLRGHVTGNGLVLLSLRDAPHDKPEMIGQLTGFLAHEVFHLWNIRGGDFPASEAWLHEGSAEYYSWLAVQALWPREIDLAARLQRAWDSCMVFAGTRPIMEMGGRARYTCGAIAQWAVDIGVRRASGNARDGLHLWADLLAPRRGGYDLAAFRAAAAEHGRPTAPLLDAFIETGWDWPSLARQLSEAGAEVSVGPPSEQALRFAVAEAIGRTLCSGFSGGGWNAKREYFVVGDDCAGFSGQLYLLRANGLDPMGDPAEFYQAVRRVCAVRGTLDLVVRERAGPAERSVTCTAEVEAAKPHIQIKRALPLNPPARSAP